MGDLDNSDGLRSGEGEGTRPSGSHGTPGERSAPALGRAQLKREVLLSRMFPAEVARPTLGRYEVLEFLGEGGMGTVYAAHDPRLDRKVAVKLLRGASSEPRQRERLVREAKALARFSHAHVVTVHEVWDEGGELYIAMEFVEGRTLAGWQRERRPWREVLDAYLQAGEGLAAVHEAGLVYRDFKPANAIRREEDGVVKLLDFGLARVEAHAPTVSVDGSLAAGRQGTGATALAHDGLTRAGTILGTPAYMAPEQFEGSPADARSDQFGFGVSLWEALFGQRPFARRSSLAAVVHDEPRVEPPSDHGVPAWVQRVVERSLAADPGARYPSMRALLRDLRADPSVRRRRVLGGIGVAAAAVVGGLVVAELRAEPSSACVEVSTAWGETQRGEARAGVLRAGGPAAQQTWELLGPRLDRYGDELSRLRLEACEAHRRGLLPEEHHALQVACLDRREAGFSALVELLRRADASVVGRANRAVLELPSPAGCADVDALRGDQPPIEEPAVAARVAELRQELARASTEESAGLYDEAVARAGAVLEAAEPLGYRPLRAEALVRRGSARMQAGQPEAAADLDEALWLSLETEQRRVAAEAAAKRIFVRVDPQGEDRDVGEAITLARTLAARVGAADWSVRWALANNTGIVHDVRGAPGPALSAFEEALGVVPEGDDLGRFERSTTLMNMAQVQQRLGRIGEAIESSGRAIEEITAVFGPAHPQVLETRVSLARVHRLVGHH
ncbi:MAG: protein kinase, partial [Myxococcales bacterium]|nr:protein kinase [Myxococcales bacterium]